MAVCLDESLILLMENTKPATRNLSRRKTVFGVGVNDVDFITSIEVPNGVSQDHPAYSCWRNMLKRCYNTSSLTAEPTYNDVEVCKEWTRFSNFYLFWKKNSLPDYHLDKDILFPGNRTYSESACIFIPAWVNTFINVKNKNNDLPIGVYKHTKNNMFIADLSKNGKSNYLGSYSNPVAANHAWGIAKLGHLHELKQKLDEVDIRLFPKMFSLIVDLIV